MTSSELCASCAKALPTLSRFLACCECNKSYHLGKCSGLSEAQAKNKSETFFVSWKCTNCYSQRLRGQGGGKEGNDQDVRALLNTILERLEKLDNLPAQVDSIDKAISHLSDKYDEILKTMNQQDAEIKHLCKRVDVLEVQDNPAQIQELKFAVHNLEWRSRRQNLIFHGIAQSDKEDLLSKINAVGQSLSLPVLAKSDVEALHRLPSKAGRVPGVIVRFVKLETKSEWLQGNKRLREGRSKVSITENMTQHSRILLQSAKQWADRNDFKYAWHRDGKVYVRKGDGERAHVIQRAEDLTRLAV